MRPHLLYTYRQNQTTHAMEQLGQEADRSTVGRLGIETNCSSMRRLDHFSKYLKTYGIFSNFFRVLIKKISIRRTPLQYFFCLLWINNIRNFIFIYQRNRSIIKRGNLIMMQCFEKKKRLCGYEDRQISLEQSCIFL